MDALTIVFWISVAVVFYTYVGYPLLTISVGGVRRREVAEGPDQPTISIIIAARNEARSIRATLENKLALDYAPGRIQIIVVSDASDDGTDAIAKEFADEGVLVLRQEPRRGKTAALNLAAQYATGEVLVFADANSIYAPDALAKLVRSFSDPEVGYVTGRMAYRAESGCGVGLGCRAYMAYEDLLRRSETRLGSIVGVNGGIDAVRRSLYIRMADDQLPDFVLPLSVVKNGYRVVYEPDAILEEETLTTSRAEYRMRVRVALRAWWTLSDMRELFDARRFGVYSFQLLSHKVLRYLAFAALPVVYLAAFGLSSSGLVYQSAFAASSLLMLCAAVGYLFERTGRSNPLVSIPYYFLLINAAAAEAALKFALRRKQAVWTPRLG